MLGLTMHLKCILGGLTVSRLRVSLTEIAGVKWDNERVKGRLVLMGITDPKTLDRLCKEMRQAHERDMFLRAIRQPARG